MRLLVTGGSGFLGQRVVAAAVAQGHRVALLSRKPHLLAPPEGAEALGADLTDPPSVDAAVARAAPDAVVHAAAVISNTHPDLRAVNVAGTATLLAALGKLPGAPRVVHISSFAVEDIPPTPYSDAKLEGERLVRASRLPFVILRPTLIYGPDDPSNTARLVQRMRGGTMWLPGGGRALIQPVFVDDVAAACVAAATTPGIEGRTYRLGGPAPLSVAEYRSAVRDATGGATRIRGIPVPLFAVLASTAALLGQRGLRGVLEFHIADHVVDIADARRDLGFAPRPLAEGLAATFG